MNSTQLEKTLLTIKNYVDTTTMNHFVHSAVVDVNTLKTTGIYSLTSNCTNNATTNAGTLIVDFNVGTPYQLWIPDNTHTFYKRNWDKTNSVWKTWSNKITGNITGNADGNAGTATKLANKRNITLTGDATGSAQFDGSGDAQITVSINGTGNAGSADKLNNALKVQLNGGTTEGTNQFTFNGSADKTINITPSAIGIAHATAAPKANGTAAVGTSSKAAREDHVHPSQTSVSGNAGTATKFQSAQSVTLSGDVIGTASSQAGWSVETVLATTGVTAGSYGPNQNATPGYNNTFNVPYITVDDKGRVTAASTKTVKIPASDNTDQKVKSTLSTTTKFHLTGTTATATTTGEQYFDTGVYVSANAGELVATKFKGALEGNVTGNLTGTATNATQADQDSAGQQINTTYIKGLSASGRTITYTKGDGTTGTITTQDNNTDTKVNVTLGTTTKAYLLGTSTTPTSSAQGVTSIADTGVYLDTTAGQLVATTFKGNLTGNAGSADKLKTARTISLAGDATGETTFDGSGDVQISVEVKNDSHTHKSMEVKGTNTITKTTDDTTANWGKQKNSVHWYSATGQLVDQPGQYGLLYNITDGSSEVHQLWLTQASGDMKHRGGNASGWSGSWRTLLDTSNFKTHVTPSAIGAYTKGEVDTKVSSINSTATANLTAAKAYADEKIAALVDSAPDAMNTLNELASAISSHQSVYDAYVADISKQLSGKAPTSHASTGTSYGVASDSNYGHAKASGTTPKANGTAAVGSETGTFARGDHVHPLQTTISGNAGSASKVNNNIVIKLNGGATEGTNLFTFNGSAAKTINITPDAIGAAASSHGTHLTLGTGSGNAFRGDYGNTAYTHSQQTHAPSNAQKNSDITKDEIEAKLTGAITKHYHTQLGAIDLSSKTASLNDYVIKTGNVKVQRYFCPTDGNGANITGRPDDSSKQAFILIVESIRSVSDSDYICKQTYIQGSTKKTHVRYCTSGTWSAWEKVYTSGQKPTLSELGAAASGHTHDDRYYTESEIETKLSGKSNTDHTHNYAGSSSAGGAATSANKVNKSLSIQLNGGTAKTFDGSSEVSINITPDAIGAAKASHGTHLTLGETSSTAYRGDRGASAYAHSIAAHAPSNAQKNSDITKTEIENKLTGNITTHTHSYLPLAGGTITGPIKSASMSGTHVGGATSAVINSTASNGVYQSMVSGKTTNGSMVIAFYQGNLRVDYLTKANVDAGTNTVTKNVILMNESGGGTWQGTVTAPTFSGALSGNATTATSLQTARSINGTNFDGSANITTASWGTSRSIYIQDSDGTNKGTAVAVDGSANATLKLPATIKATLTGNASTATKLAASKTINGTNFDGSANITTANWGTARTITIGATGKSVNGSGNVSWSRDEIGFITNDEVTQSLNNVFGSSYVPK